MARPTLPDDALVGDAGHATDHNTLRDAIAALYGERATGNGPPEGVVTGVVGALYIDQLTGEMYVKITGTGNTGWQSAQAGSRQHASLSGLTTGNDHTQYQLGAAKGVANGYASLDASGKVPYAQENIGTAAGTVAAGDHTHPNLVPIGAVVAYGGSSAPAGWLLCDGAAIPGTYTALIALVGSVTPNLRDRFIVGAGSSYAVKATGGAATVTLTAAESGMPSHAHTASSGTESADHSHSANPGAVTTSSNSHNHTISLREGTGTGDGYYVDTNPTDSGTQKTLSGTVTSTYAHTHTVDLPTITTGGRSAAHTHAITVNAAGALNATQDHENRPPYYALTYIIRAV